MPLYSDLGLYYPGSGLGLGLGLGSYYGGGWGLSRPRFSPLLPPLAELGRRYSPLPPTRVSSPRRYLPPRPTYVDTADIDVVSPRMNPVTGGLREIRRDRTLVRIHTAKLKDSPALQKARRKTPGERLVEKFLIRDKADEAKRKADEIKEKEKMLKDLAASARTDAPVIGGMSEADALDILLTSEEQKLAQDVRRKPTLKSLGSTKRKSKRRDSLPEEPDPGSLPGDAQRKPSLLQRRNTVKKRRNSQDLSLDVQAALSSRRSSLVSEVDPMDALVEAEEAGDKKPALKFVVDEVSVEESPVSPRKFRYEVILEDVPDDANHELSPKSFQNSKCRPEKSKAVEKVSSDKTPDASKSKVKSPISGKLASVPKKTVPGATDGVRFPVTLKNLKPIVEEANQSTSVDGVSPAGRKIETRSDTDLMKPVTKNDTVSIVKDRSVVDSKIVGSEYDKKSQVSSKNIKRSTLSSASCLSEETPVPIEVNGNDSHKTEQNLSKEISNPRSETKQSTAAEEKIKVVSQSRLPDTVSQNLELNKKRVVSENTEIKKPKVLTPIENVIGKTIELADVKSSPDEEVSNLEKTQAKKFKPLGRTNISDEISDPSNNSTSTKVQLVFAEKTQSNLPKRLTRDCKNVLSTTEDQSKIFSPPPSPKSQEKKMKVSANELDETGEVSAKCETVVKQRKPDLNETPFNTQMLGEKTKITPTTESNVTVAVKTEEDQNSSPLEKHIGSNSLIQGEKILGKVGVIKTKIPPTAESVIVGVKNKEDQKSSTQDKHIKSNSQIQDQKTLGKVGALKSMIPPNTESVIVDVKNVEDQKASTLDAIASISQITGEKTIGTVAALKTKINHTTESVIEGVKNKEDQQSSTQDKRIEANSQILGEKIVGQVGALKTKTPPTTESNVTASVKNKEDQQMSTQEIRIESKNKSGSSPKPPPSPKSSDTVEKISKSFPKLNKLAVSNNSESSAITHVNEKQTVKTESKEEPSEEINFWAFIKGAEEEYVARPIFRTNSEPNRQKREYCHSVSEVENQTGSSSCLDSPTSVDNTELKPGAKVRRDAGKSNALHKDNSTIPSPNSQIPAGPLSKGRNENAAKPPLLPKVPKGLKTLAKSEVASNFPSSGGSKIAESSKDSVTTSVNPLTKPDLHLQNVMQESESKSLPGKSENSSELSKSKDVPNTAISNYGKENIDKKLNTKSENQKMNLPRSPNDPFKKFNFKTNTELSGDVPKMPDEKTEKADKNCNTNSEPSNLLKSAKEKSETSKLLSDPSELHDNKINDCDSLKLKQNKASCQKTAGSSVEENVIHNAANTQVPKSETKATANEKENKDPSGNAPKKDADSNEKCKTMANNIPKKVIKKPKQLVKSSKTTDLSHLQDALKLRKDEDKTNKSSESSSLTNVENKCANTAKSATEFPGILPRRSKTPPAEKKVTTGNDQSLFTKMVKGDKEDLKAKLSSQTPSGTEVISEKLQVEEPKTQKLVPTDPSSAHTPTEKMETITASNAAKTEKSEPLYSKKKEANQIDEDTHQNQKTVEAPKKMKKTEMQQPDSATGNSNKTKPPTSPNEIIKKLSENPKNIMTAVEVNLAKIVKTVENPPNAQVKSTALEKKNVLKGSQLPESPKDATKKNLCHDSVAELNEKDFNVKPKYADLEDKSPEIPTIKANNERSVEPGDTSLDKTIQLKFEPQFKIKTGNDDGTKSKDKLVRLDDSDFEKKTSVSPTKDLATKTAAITEVREITKTKTVEPSKNAEIGKKDVDKTPALNQKEKVITEAKVITKTKTVEPSKIAEIGKKEDVAKTPAQNHKEKVITEAKAVVASKNAEIGKPPAPNQKEKVITEGKEITKTKTVEPNKNAEIGMKDDVKTADPNQQEKVTTEVKEISKTKTVEASKNAEIGNKYVVKTLAPNQKEKKIVSGKEKRLETVDSKPKIKKVVKNKVAKTEVSVDNNKCNKDEKANGRSDKSKPKEKRETASGETESHDSENVIDAEKPKKLVFYGGADVATEDQGEKKIVKDDKEPKKDVLSKPKMGKVQKAKVKDDDKQVVTVAKYKDKDESQQDEAATAAEMVPEQKDSITAKKASCGDLFSDSESESSSQRTSTSSNDSGFDSLPVPSTASDREGASPLASNPALALDDGPRHPALTIPRFRKYGAQDFQFLKVLGKGSFGKVLLAELRGTERYYAVKCLKKDVVLEDNDVECTLIERKVLALGTRHPYLCHLFCTFQTESHLLFVLEYLNGGDLMFHIQQSGRFPEPRARFYAAEIVSGLKFLHKKGIVYRDLKLDNILLDFDGHIRIADFGMCKLQIFLDRMADTFCGTPDYMAPEIIKGLRYNQCVDWWSFGILLYEMLIGVSPFSGCDDNELFWSICNETPQYPRFLSQEAHSILLLLLEKDTTKRLGTPECPAGDITDQPFFRTIDWFALERRELEPPFKPRVQHPLDVQYFDTTFTTERAQLTPVDKSILETMDQTQFEGFSYTNPYATD